MADQEMTQRKTISAINDWLVKRSPLYDYPSEKLKFIGIVEEKGRRNAAQLIANMLACHGLSVDIKNTDELFHYSFEEKNLFLLIDRYLNYLQKQVDNKKDVIIFQICKDFMNIYPLLQTPFDIFMHTMSEPNGINMQGEIVQEIGPYKAFIDHLPKNCVIAVSMDNLTCVDFLEVLKDRMVITYGLSSRATVTASSIETEPFLKFHFCIQRGITTNNGVEIEPMEFPAQFRLLGTWSVYDILAAATGAMVLGVLPEEITSGFAGLEGYAAKTENEKNIYISY